MELVRGVRAGMAAAAAAAAAADGGRRGGGVLVLREAQPVAGGQHVREGARAAKGGLQRLFG